MITFDDLGLSGQIIFDDLDGPSEEGALQNADVSLTLEPASTSSHIGIWEQLFDAEIVLDSNAAQEYVSTGTAVAYIQSANVQSIYFSGAGQEHIAVAGGEFGQSGTVEVVLSAGGTQYYVEFELSVGDVVLTLDGFDAFQEVIIPGGFIYEHGADFVLVFGGISLHDYEDQFYGPAGIDFANSVAGIVAGHTEFHINLYPALAFTPGAIHIKFVSSATEWLTDNGLSGLPVGAEISLGATPLASVVPSKNYIIVQPHMAIYNAVRSALMSGEAVFRVRGFEFHTGMVVDQPFAAQSNLQVRAYA